MQVVFLSLSVGRSILFIFLSASLAGNLSDAEKNSLAVYYTHLSLIMNSSSVLSFFDLFLSAFFFCLLSLYFLLFCQFALAKVKSSMYEGMNWQIYSSHFSLVHSYVKARAYELLKSDDGRH